MSLAENILSSKILSAFGWTLIHSFWIGGIIFLITWFLLFLFRNSKSNFRYTIAVGGLFTFMALVIYAFFKIYALQSSNYGLNLTIGENFRNITNNFLEASNLNNISNNFSLSSIENYINQNIPFLVIIWLLGLLVFSLRFAGGLIYTYRLRSGSKQIKNDEIDNILLRIIQKINIKSKIQIKESSLISTPMVIGFIKPIILLPLGMANGLSLHQVEAILFHEIAHIYRIDYLVNLIQSIVEVVLFYHPVVWWLSAHIRSERENICDDIAIEHTGSALAYAKALTNLQELNNQTPDIVLAFSNKKNRFMNRIRRLLGLPQINSNLMEGLISSLLIIISVILLSTHAGPVFGQAKDLMNTNKNESILLAPETPVIVNQDQAKTEKEKLNNKAKQIENELLKNHESILISVRKISDIDKILESDLKKIQQNITKSGTLDKTLINNIEEKSIAQTNIILKKLDEQKNAHKVISEKLKSLSPQLDPAIATRLSNQLFKNKELIQKSSQMAQIAHTRLKEHAIKMVELAQMNTQEIQANMFNQQDKMNKEQKQLQMEMQKMEKYQNKVSAFALQAQKELLMKQQELKKIQMEMENSDPTEEQQQKFEAMKAELKSQESKFAKIQEAQKKNLQEIKDQMEDMRDDVKEKEDEMEMKKLAEKTDMETGAEYDADSETDRQTDLEMINKKLKYKELIDIFSKNLIADGLIEKNKATEFVLSTQNLTINGKEQSNKFFKKYSKLLAKTQGEKLKDGKKFILNF